MLRITHLPGSPSTYRHVGLSCLLGATFALATPIAPASAVEPTRQTVVQVGVHSTAPCPSGIVLQGSFDITRTITTYYDAAGSPIRRLSSNRADGTWRNPDTGAWLPSSVVREVHTDLTTGESFATGAYVRTWLPGGGVAIGGAGLQLFDASGAPVAHFGPDPVAERGQLCAALGA